MIVEPVDRESLPRLNAHPLRTLLTFSFTNAMCWLIALGTPMVLLAGELGATTVEVGLAYTAVFLTLPLQVLATATLPRFGYKRQMIFAWSTRTFFLLVPLGLAILAPFDDTRTPVYALLGSVVCFALFRALGSCAVMPWIYSLVPEPIRGRYFATDQSITGAAGVGTLVLCSALFVLLPNFTAAAWQYGFALLGSLLSIALLTSLPDVARPAATTVPQIIRETPSRCLRPGDFRFYVGFMVAANMVMTAFPPFIAYYLKVSQNWPSDRILLFTALQYVGNVAAAFFVRSQLDRTGVKPFFRLALVGQVVLMVFWIHYVLGAPLIGYLIPVAYFGFGATITAWNAAHLSYLPRVCPEPSRALAISIHSSVVGVLGGLAPILWGLFLKAPGANAGMPPHRFALYLAITAGVQIILFILVSRLRSANQDRLPLPVFGQLYRSFRFLGSLINPIVPRADEPAGASPDAAVKTDS